MISDVNSLTNLGAKADPKAVAAKVQGMFLEVMRQQAGQHSSGSEPHTDQDSLPVNGVISSPQGWRHDPINGELRYHAGTDIAAPSGTLIHAVADGRVVESGSKGSFGNTVVVESNDGRKMLNGHNNQNFVAVQHFTAVVVRPQ